MLTAMGKGKRLKATRPAKLARRARRTAAAREPRDESGPVDFGALLSRLTTPSDDGDFFDFVPPDENDPMWDTSHCPIDDHCAGCSSTEPGLHVMVSSFGSDAACATVCRSCDGRSMLHLQEVGLGGLDERVEAHRSHVSASAE